MSFCCPQTYFELPQFIPRSGRERFLQVRPCLLGFAIHILATHIRKKQLGATYSRSNAMHTPQCDLALRTFDRQWPTSLKKPGADLEAGLSHGCWFNPEFSVSLQNVFPVLNGLSPPNTLPLSCPAHRNLRKGQLRRCFHRPPVYKTRKMALNSLFFHYDAFYPIP